jgi:Tfp pilus assembly protein FimT
MIMMMRTERHECSLQRPGTQGWRAGAPRGARRAFTLLDIFVTMAVMLVVAALVLPGSAVGSDAQTRLLAAGTIIASDLEFAQVHNITFPDDPVVVRFDVSENRYWVAFADSTETPMPRPDNGDPYDVRLGVGRAVAAAGASLSVEGLPSDTLQFNAQGGINGLIDSPVITLELDDRWYSLTISPVTGSMVDDRGSDEP